jgi:hypothetical protein
MNIFTTPQYLINQYAVPRAVKLSIAICALALTACSSASYGGDDTSSAPTSAVDAPLDADCPSICEATKDCPDANPTPEMTDCEAYCADLADYNELSNCTNVFDDMLDCHAEVTDICGACNAEKGEWMQCVNAGPNGSDPAGGTAGGTG